ncbi:type I restriction-modification system subunit M [Deinococcus antarcticus]|uniref:site-specific DNA-methyltransferase (adenine-specific) n=1 Tax=Deinococcus antarcticus TaxID=1298767 RepID=A0ABV8AE98_9DEIO
MTASTRKSKTKAAAPARLEEVLWNTADQLRGHMDAAEYKHVVLGLVFLKYISDAFGALHARLKAEVDEETAEDRDEYIAEGVFWVPREARWDELKDNAKQPDIGKRVDEAMAALERENPKQLKGMLPTGYARPSLPSRVIGGLIDEISKYGTGGTVSDNSGDLFSSDQPAQKAESDLLGRVYQYMLGRFAAAEGKLGGEFYTPDSVVQTLVEMLAPYKGRVYDPACGSGGMFVQSEKFVEAHKGRIGDIAIYGQESNHTTWKLARMNLAIRRIDADLGKENADTFHQDLHPDLRADYVLANPPFNVSNWGGERLQGDPRWKYGTPPVGNANYAWLQHILHHLAPNGTAGVVLANGSLSSNQSGEGEIRRNMIAADKVDCIVAMPGQLFYTTQIPVSLWFLANNKQNGKGQEGRTLRDRSGQILFIDARELGYMRTRTERDLTPEDRARITSAYHNWRGDGEGEYEDIPGFCKVADIDEIEKNGWVLTPGRYVGAAAKEEDSEPFGEKMTRLSSDLREQFAESDRLQAVIKANLEKLGYGG